MNNKFMFQYEDVHDNKFDTIKDIEKFQYEIKKRSGYNLIEYYELCVDYINMKMKRSIEDEIIYTKRGTSKHHIFENPFGFNAWYIGYSLGKTILIDQNLIEPKLCTFIVFFNNKECEVNA